MVTTQHKRRELRMQERWRYSIKSTWLGELRKKRNVEVINNNNNTNLKKYLKEFDSDYMKWNHSTL